MAGEPFDAFAERMYPLLTKTAWLIMGRSNAEAEDLAQEALVAVWRRWGTLRIPGSEKQYAMTTLVRLARRQRSTSVRLARRLRDQTATAHDENTSMDTVDNDLWLTSAISRLPLRQRQVIVLRYFADLSQQSTASVLGCSVGTVKSSAHKAMQALNSYLANVSLTESQNR